MTTISNSTLSASVKTSLNAKLQAALKAVQAGDTATACSDLQNFINEVNSQRGKKIPATFADSLTSTATTIGNQLGCGPLATNNNGTHNKSPDIASMIVWDVAFNFVMSHVL
jgi:hypothetical protein